MSKFYSVADVAREAAELRVPVAGDPSTDAMAAAWRAWTVAAFLTRIKVYALDKEIVIFAGDTLLARPLDIQMDEWQIDEAARSFLLSSLSDADVEVMPTFDVPPCPQAVPPALLLLPSSQRVRLRWNWRRQFQADAVVSDAVDEFEGIIARQAKGWLSLDEAAQLLTDAGRGAAATWRQKFLAVAQTGRLPTHEPGTYERVVYESPSQPPRRARDFYGLAHIDDLNQWLAEHEPRLPFRFDAAPSATNASSPPMPRQRSQA